MIDLQNMQQGSDSWLELRKSKICASEAPIILGISPWKSPLMLWEEKTGRRESGFKSAAMQYGTDMEPVIRSWFEEKEQTWFIPEVVIGSKHDWMLASLDGISADRETILEIKTCNATVFADAKKHNVPDYYIAQAQHQMACVDKAKLVHFVFCHKGEYAEVKLFRDVEYIEKMIFAESKFYQDCIVNDQPPEKEKRDEPKADVITINDLDAVLIADELKTLLEEKKDMANREKSLRERLIDFASDRNCVIGSLTLSKSKGRVTIGYKQACLDNNIDLKSYETQGAESWKIT